MFIEALSPDRDPLSVPIHLKNPELPLSGNRLPIFFSPTHCSVYQFLYRALCPRTTPDRFPFTHHPAAAMVSPTDIQHDLAVTSIAAERPEWWFSKLALTALELAPSTLQPTFISKNSARRVPC